MLSVMAVEPTPGVLFGAVSQGDYQAIAEILKLWPHLVGGANAVSIPLSLLEVSVDQCETRGQEFAAYCGS